MLNCIGPIVASRDGLIVINCRFCGYAHLASLPAEKMIEDYYGAEDQEYNTVSGVNWSVLQQRHYERKLWDSRFEFESRLIAGTSPLLDVGAGLGHFVDWYCKHKGEAFGIEPSESARSWSQLHNACRLFPDADSVRTTRFRVIRFCLVLEHLLTPNKTLEDYLKLLLPKGYLLIVVPNEFNSLQLRLRQRLGDWFVDSRHLNYFTEQTLKSLLESLGLHVLRTATTFPTELWRLFGCNSERSGLLSHLVRLHLERLVGTKAFFCYRGLYRKFGWGREIIMVAQKA